MKPAGPVRPYLTDEQRRFVVRLLLDIVEDLQFTSPTLDMDGLEEMQRYGPTGVRIRDLKRIDREDALDILEKIDYEGSMHDYHAWLRYYVDGPVIPHEPPGAIPLGPVPS